MKPTSRMWISAGLTGLILAGGASIAVAASAARIDQVERQAETGRDSTPVEPSSAAPAPLTVPGGTARRERREAGSSAAANDIVVTRRLTTDPETVLKYWTDERIREAGPAPMPVVVVDPTQ